jgi:serine/threonine protein kinase
MIGKIISHYKILAKLGEGGMGVVYKAEDTRLKRLVALKFLPSSIMASEAEKARFIHEAQAAAALNHPNICTIHEIDEAEGHLFIAMEFVEGQSLKEKVASGMLQVASVIDIAIQIAEGLQAAHEKKITHRDIKPANVMLTPKGQVKIMDFGLAKLAGRSALTKEGMTLGTVAYMSPEQARGENVDHRTDIWAFGVVLYEITIFAFARQAGWRNDVTAVAIKKWGA